MLEMKNRYSEFGRTMMNKYCDFGQYYDTIALLFPEESAYQPEETAASQTSITNLYQLNYLKEENHLYQRNLTFLSNLYQKVMQKEKEPSIEYQVERVIKEQLPELEDKLIQQISNQFYTDIHQETSIEQVEERLGNVLLRENITNVITHEQQVRLARNITNVLGSVHHIETSRERIRDNAAAVVPQRNQFLEENFHQYLTERRHMTQQIQQVHTSQQVHHTDNYPVYDYQETTFLNEQNQNNQILENYKNTENHENTEHYHNIENHIEQQNQQFIKKQQDLHQQLTVQQNQLIQQKELVQNQNQINTEHYHNIENHTEQQNQQVIKKQQDLHQQLTVQQNQLIQQKELVQNQNQIQQHQTVEQHKLTEQIQLTHQTDNIQNNHLHQTQQVQQTQMIQETAHTQNNQLVQNRQILSNQQQIINQQTTLKQELSQKNYTQQETYLLEEERKTKQEPPLTQQFLEKNFENYLENRQTIQDYRNIDNQIINNSTTNETRIQQQNELTQQNHSITYDQSRQLTLNHQQVENKKEISNQQLVKNEQLINQQNSQTLHQHQNTQMMTAPVLEHKKDESAKPVKESAEKLIPLTQQFISQNFETYLNSRGTSVSHTNANTYKAIQNEYVLQNWQNIYTSKQEPPASSHAPAPLLQRQAETAEKEAAAQTSQPPLTEQFLEQNFKNYQNRYSAVKNIQNIENASLVLQNHNTFLTKEHSKRQSDQLSHIPIIEQTLANYQNSNYAVQNIQNARNTSVLTQNSYPVTNANYLQRQSQNYQNSNIAVQNIQNTRNTSVLTQNSYAVTNEDYLQRQPEQLSHVPLSRQFLTENYKNYLDNRTNQSNNVYQQRLQTDQLVQNNSYTVGNVINYEGNTSPYSTLQRDFVLQEYHLPLTQQFLTENFDTYLASTANQKNVYQATKQIQNTLHHAVQNTNNLQMNQYAGTSQIIEAPSVELTYEIDTSRREKAQAAKQLERIEKVHEELHREKVLIEQTRNEVSEINKTYEKWKTIQADPKQTVTLNSNHGRELIHQEVMKSIDRQMGESINQIAGQVYRRLEEKLRSERDRRGLI